MPRWKIAPQTHHLDCSHPNLPVEKAIEETDTPRPRGRPACCLVCSEWSQVSVSFPLPLTHPLRGLCLLSMLTTSERPPTHDGLPPLRVWAQRRGGGCCMNALSPSPLHRSPSEQGAYPLLFVTLVSYKYVCIVCASLLL